MLAHSDGAVDVWTMREWSRTAAKTGKLSSKVDLQPLSGLAIDGGWTAQTDGSGEFRSRVDASIDLTRSASPSAGAGAHALLLEQGSQPNHLVYAVSFSTGELIRYETSDPAGTRTTLLPGGLLVSPASMVMGPDGNLYIGENGDGSTFAPRISKFEPATFTISTIYPFGAFDVFPASLVFQGNDLLIGRNPIYGNTGPIVKLSNATGGSLSVSDYTSGGGLASSPGLGLGADGQLYVSDQTYDFGTGIASGPVKRFDVDGQYVGELIANGANGLHGPTGMVVSGNFLYTSSIMTGTVLRTDLTTDATTMFASTGAPFEAGPLALMSDGGLLVGSPSGNGAIYQVDAAGTLQSTFASGLGQVGGLVALEIVVPATVTIETPGPRLMALPDVPGLGFSSFLTPLWTQGAVGADTEQGTPNIYTFDGAEWIPVADLTAGRPQPGQGFMVMVYGDTDFDGTDDLPVSLSASGTRTVSRVDRPLSFEEDRTAGAAGTGWNLAGNPFDMALDAGRLEAGRQEGPNPDIGSTLYVYDPESGQWRTWNREAQTGTLEGGLIAPMQGFFVQASKADASLVIDPSMRADSRGTFFKSAGAGPGSGLPGTLGNPSATARQSGATVEDAQGDSAPPALWLEVRLAGESSILTDRVALSFSTRGDVAVESTDSYKLAPLAAVERLVARLVGREAGHGMETQPQTAVGGVSLEIQNLPTDLPGEFSGVIRIPLDIQHLVPEGVEDAGEDGAWMRYAVRGSAVRLGWSGRNLQGHGVGVTLVERGTDRRVVLAGTGVADSGWVDLQLPPSDPYTIGAERVYAVDREPGFELVVEFGATGVSIRDGGAGGEGGSNALPERFELRANYPNPFNPSTQLAYALPQAAEVRLEVFDATGRRVAVLAEGLRAAGVHTVVFEAGALASGIYIARLTAPGFVRSRPMILLK